MVDQEGPLIDPDYQSSVKLLNLPPKYVDYLVISESSLKSQINKLQDFHSNRSLKSNLCPLF
jgi:hypothetical protein